MNRIPDKFLLLLLLLAPLALGASAAETPLAEESLDEVVVSGAKLSEMMREMVKVEDKFFKRYNELNTNDEFDTYCKMETRAGTAIRRRYCHSGYEAKALEIQGQDYALFLQNNAAADWNPGQPMPPPPTLMGAPPTPASVTIEARRKDYQQNVREVVARNPELLPLLQERNDLGQRYDAAMRRKARGSKPPPAEVATPASPNP